MRKDRATARIRHQAARRLRGDRDVQADAEQLALAAGDAAGKILRVLGGHLELRIDQPAAVRIDASCRFQPRPLTAQPLCCNGCATGSMWRATSNVPSAVSKGSSHPGPTSRGYPVTAKVLTWRDPARSEALRISTASGPISRRGSTMARLPCAGAGISRRASGHQPHAGLSAWPRITSPGAATSPSDASPVMACCSTVAAPRPSSRDATSPASASVEHMASTRDTAPSAIRSARACGEQHLAVEDGVLP